MLKYLSFVLVAINTLLVGAAHAQQIEVPSAPQSKGPQPPVTAWNGSYTTAIDIDVPDFRGLGPDLKISYDSARGIRGLYEPGGNLGIGWQLSGLSYIQRVAGSFPPAAGEDALPGGKGVPAYGAPDFPPDGFTLDGQELVACTSEMTTSPSCATEMLPNEMAYAGRNETYERIRYNTTLNIWTVTNKLGVTTTYTSMEGNNPFRWLADTVEDRNGNQVKFDWNCGTGKNCSISEISSFNEDRLGQPIHKVVFTYHTRPDPFRYASGKDLRTVENRLETIEVWSSNTKVRSYLLAYGNQSPQGYSFLASVAENGRAMNGTTPLLTKPPFKFVYGTTVAVGNPSRTEWQNFQGEGIAFGGDYNGDGIPLDSIVKSHRYLRQGSYGVESDIYQCWKTAHFSNGAGGYLASSDTVKRECSGPNTNPNVAEGVGPGGDFNGDGLSDFSTWSTVSEVDCDPTSDRSTSWCTRSSISLLSWTQDNGVGSIDVLASRTHESSSTPSIVLGPTLDANGDGRTDFLSTNGTVVFVRNGGFDAKNWNVPDLYVNWEDRYTKKNMLVDANGDGKSDILQVRTNDEGNWVSRISLSTGTSYVAQSWQLVPIEGNLHTTGVLLADANGDGLTDMILVSRHSTSQSQLQVRTLLSKGKHFDTGGELTQTVNIGGFTNLVAPNSYLGYSGLERVSVPNPYDIYTPSHHFNSPLAAVGDFDGNDLADIIVVDDGHLRVVNDVSQAPILGQASQVAADLSGNDAYLNYSVLDADGDGRDEVFEINKSYLQPAKQYLHQLDSLNLPLLNSITTPLGGKTMLKYRTSKGLPDTRLPFTMQLVEQMTINDGRGNVATTDFAYEGGRWDYQERQFLGFGKITATLPANEGETARPVVETHYAQSKKLCRTCESGAPAGQRWQSADRATGCLRK